MPKKTSYTYGKSPNPASWHETATILKDLKPKKKKSSEFFQKMEKLMKAQKG